MRIDVEEDFDEVGPFVRAVYRDQIPFATARAVNETATAFQAAERAHMEDVFTIRRRRFMERSVKIRRGEFATKRKPEARVRIDSPGGRSDIFAKFEEGGVKRPRGQRLAIPQEAIKRTKRGVIRKSQRPRRLIDRLQLEPVGRRVFSRKGTGVWKGKQRTFMIRTSGGGGGIFRRFGPRRGDYRALYLFAPEADIPDNLKFVENARETVNKDFERNFEKAFDRAIRTARTPQIGG